MLKIISELTFTDKSLKG